MKRAVAVAAVLVVAIAADGRAQIGRLAGTVVDDTGRPLKGATITAENRDQRRSTFTSSSDGKGRFSVLGMSPGTWTFTIQAPGFETAVHRLDVVTTRPNPPLDVRLVRRPASAPATALVGVETMEIQRRIDSAEAADKAGDAAAALAAYRDLLTRVPALTSIYLRMGAIHERSGDKAAALAAYTRLLELDPENAPARAAVDRLHR
jgi:tetratricopeptide (TPR) repeat protein